MSAFLDTNILVYAQKDWPQTTISQDLIAQGGTISVQVLNELTNVLRKKDQRSWRVPACVGTTRSRNQTVAHPSESASACSSTVWVAFS